MIDYRLATVEDTPALEQVKRAVWPEENTELTRITGVIADPAHRIVVAAADSRVVGFVAAFTTEDSDGLARWEVDLLAVDPSMQRRGVGRALVRQITEIGSGAALARALIRVDNIGSQRAFAAGGYAPSAGTYALYVAPARGSDEATPPETGLRVIPVSTLIYAGLWLEGVLTADQLAVAPAWVPAGADRIVGAVIESEQVAALNPDSAGYERVGTYRRWVHDYSARC